MEKTHVLKSNPRTVFRTGFVSETCRMCRALTLSLSILLTGCGTAVRTDYAQLELVQVWGAVKLDGKPLAGGIVQFESQDQTYSFGQTDHGGRYHMMFNSERRGVTPGPKVVRIRTSGGLGEEESAPLEGEIPAVNQPELVPACYNMNSQLTITVGRRSQRIDFDLKSSGEP